MPGHPLGHWDGSLQIFLVRDTYISLYTHAWSHYRFVFLGSCLLELRHQGSQLNRSPKMLAFSNHSNSQVNTPISLFSCLQSHWTMKIYCHDFQLLDGMSTIPSTFVSPPTIQKHSSKRLPIQLLLCFLLGVNSGCWTFQSTFVKFLCEMSEKKKFSFQAKSTLILTNTISIKCPHLLKLPGQVQVQVVVGVAVQVAAEWILTQKLQRQTEKTTMDGRKFASRGWYFISHLRYVSTLSGGDLSGWTYEYHKKNTLGNA